MTYMLKWLDTDRNRGKLMDSGDKFNREAINTTKLSLLSNPRLKNDLPHGLPWQSSGWASTLPLSWVQAWVQELGSCMLQQDKKSANTSDTT